MTDRELLENAARAAGISGQYREDWDAIERVDAVDSFGRGEQWRPHKNDGDAFRLALDCGISLEHFQGFQEVHVYSWDSELKGRDMIPIDDGIHDRVRRAIVRASAALAEEK